MYSQLSSKTLRSSDEHHGEEVAIAQPRGRRRVSSSSRGVIPSASSRSGAEEMTCAAASPAGRPRGPRASPSTRAVRRRRRSRRPSPHAHPPPISRRAARRFPDHAGPCAGSGRSRQVLITADLSFGFRLGRSALRIAAPSRALDALRGPVGGDLLAAHAHTFSV